MIIFDNLWTKPMAHAFDSPTLTLIHDYKQFSTNPFPQNDSVVDISTQATPKMGAQVKIQNNISNASFANGHTSPRTVTHLIGSVLYDAKAGVSSASSTTCITTTS